VVSNAQYKFDSLYLTDAAFGNKELLWAAIANKPNEYYNANKFLIGFTSTGLADLMCTQWDKLAEGLVSVAGERTAGFFRKSCASPPPPPGSEIQASPLPPSKDKAHLLH
jgi:hypothetical protein